MNISKKQVILASTHEKILDFIPLEVVQKHS